MFARSPLEAVELLDAAFNRGDLEAVLDFYEGGAVMIAEPGRLATGKAEIRAAYEWIFAHIKGVARQEKTHVIEAGGVALFTSRWSFSCVTSAGESVSRESFASVVLRRNEAGGWRILVDNSWGPAVLE
jgi:ketosteroid isomerase-like protein